MKKIFVLFFCLLIVSCAGNRHFMSAISPGMDVNELRQEGMKYGFGSGSTVGIYKGYSLLGFNKSMAMPFCVIIDPNGKVVAMETKQSRKKYDLSYLENFVENWSRQKSDIKVEFK